MTTHTRTMRAFPALPLVLLLWLAGLLAAMQFAKVAVPFTDVRALYPLNQGLHGWLVSLVSLVGAALGIVAGSLIGRIGAGHMLIGGLFVGGIVSLLQGGGLSFGLMLVSRMIEGASHLAIVVAAPTLIVSVTHEKWRGAAMALWSTFFGIGFAFLALLAPPLVNSSGPSILFVVHGAAMLLLAMPLMFAIGRTPENSIAAVSSTENRAKTSRGATTFLTPHARAYGSPFIAAPAIGWLFYTLTFVALLAILPDLLAPETDQVVATAMPLVSIVVSLIVVPPLARWSGATNVVMLGFALAIGVLALGALGFEMLDVGLGVIAISLFAALGLVQGASFAAVPELNAEPVSQALAYGAMAQTGNIGNLIGTPLLLSILLHGGTAALFAVLIALYLAAIATHALLHARRRAVLEER